MSRKLVISLACLFLVVILKTWDNQDPTWYENFVRYALVFSGFVAVIYAQFTKGGK